MKVATWNLYFANTDAQIFAGLKAIAGQGADVVGVQELSNDTKMNKAKEYMRTLGYSSSRRNTAVTIFVKDATYELLKEEWRLVTDGKDRNGNPEKWEPGTGGSEVIYKGILGVQVKEKATGKISWHLNHHIVPGIEKGGKLRTDVPVRRGVYIAQMKRAVDWVNEIRGGDTLVTVTGDMNLAWATEAGVDLAKRFSMAGMTCNWAVLPDLNTHTSHRGIDYVFQVNGACSAQWLLNSFGSDHNPVVVEVVRKTDPPKPPTTVVVDKTAQGQWEVIVDKKSFLYGVPFKKKLPKSMWMKRKRGFIVRTGIGWVRRPDSTGKMRTYLRTNKDWLYAKDYLRKR